MTWKEGHRKEGYPCNSCCCHHGSSRGYHPSYSLAPLPSESCPLPLAALRRRLRRPRRHLGRLHGAVVEMWPFWLKQNRMQFQSMLHIWLLFPQLFYIAPTSFMLILMQTTSPASAASATSATSAASASAASPSPGVATASPDVAAASPELAAASPSTAVSGGSSSRITVASLRRNSGGDVSPCRNVNWAGKAPVFLMRSSWKQLESAGQVPEVNDMTSNWILTTIEDFFRHSVSVKCKAVSRSADSPKRTAPKSTMGRASASSKMKRGWRKEWSNWLSDEVRSRTLGPRKISLIKCILILWSTFLIVLNLGSKFTFQNLHTTHLLGCCKKSCGVMVKMVFLVVHRSGKSIRPLPANQHPTARNMTWQDTMTVRVLRLLACFCQNWEGRNDVLAHFRNEPQRNIPAVGIPEVFKGYNPKQRLSIGSTLHCKILPSDGLTCEHPQVSNIGCLQNVCPKLLTWWLQQTYALEVRNWFRRNLSSSRVLSRNQCDSHLWSSTCWVDVGA